MRPAASHIIEVCESNLACMRNASRRKKDINETKVEKVYVETTKGALQELQEILADDNTLMLDCKGSPTSGPFFSSGISDNLVEMAVIALRRAKDGNRFK